MSNHEVTLEEIVSLAKRRGFIFPGSEIYGGLAGTWDYGPHGVTLKNNIKKLWWKRFVDDREDMYGLDAAILMNEKVWEASGHIGGFSDPLVEDLKTKKRYRADHLLEENKIDPAGMTLEQMTAAIRENNIVSPDKNELSEVRQFNMMFKTEVGALGGQYSYLRPETAQGIFVNFKNVVDSMQPKMPFGIAQIGKAFRNEITPREFIFRVREMEQMEVEYFVHPDEWEKNFNHWLKQLREWMEDIGLSKGRIHEVDIAEEDRAHYSTKTIDIEFDFPFGQRELYGLAYRTDYDLTKHAEHSGAKLQYRDDVKGEVFTPHVIEPSLGLDRTFLAILTSAFTKDSVGGEERAYLKLKKEIAPVRVMVSPLLKNKAELQEKAREVFTTLKKEFGNVMYDDNGNIGKRYRRQDEIGTPYCVTIDFDSLEGDDVTVRNRDTAEQERVKIEDLISKLS